MTVRENEEENVKTVSEKRAGRTRRVEQKEEKRRKGRGKVTQISAGRQHIRKEYKVTDEEKREGRRRVLKEQRRE